MFAQRQLMFQLYQFLRKTDLATAVHCPTQFAFGLLYHTIYRAALKNVWKLQQVEHAFALGFSTGVASSKGERRAVIIALGF